MLVSSSDETGETTTFQETNDLEVDAEILRAKLFGVYDDPDSICNEWSNNDLFTLEKWVGFQCHWVESVTRFTAKKLQKQVDEWALSHWKVMFFFLAYSAAIYTVVYISSYILMLPFLATWNIIHQKFHMFCSFTGKGRDQEKVAIKTETLKTWQKWRQRYGFTTCVNGYHCTAGEKLFELTHNGVPFADLIQQILFKCGWILMFSVVFYFQKLSKRTRDEKYDIYAIYMTQTDDKFLSSEIVAGKYNFFRRMDLLDILILGFSHYVQSAFILLMRYKFWFINFTIIWYVLTWHVVSNAMVSTARGLRRAKHPKITKKTDKNSKNSQTISKPSITPVVSWSEEEVRFLSDIRSNQIPIMRRRLWKGEHRFIGREPILESYQRIDYLEKVNEDLEFNKKENKRLSRKNDSLKQENFTLANKSTSQNKIVGDQRKLIDRAKKLADIEGKYYALLKKLEEIEKDGEVKLLKSDEQNSKIKRLEQVNKEYLRRITEIEELKNVNSCFVTQNEQLKHEVLTLTAKVESFKQPADPSIELIQKIADLKSNLKIVETENSSMKEIILSQRNNSEVAKIVDVKSGNTETDEKKRKHKSKGSHKVEIRSLTTQINDLTKKLEVKNQDFDNFARKMETVEEKLKSKSLEYREMESVFLETKRNLELEIIKLRIKLK